jgi:hypothetical protein
MPANHDFVNEFVRRSHERKRFTTWNEDRHACDEGCVEWCPCSTVTAPLVDATGGSMLSPARVVTRRGSQVARAPGHR